MDAARPFRVEPPPDQLLVPGLRGLGRDRITPESPANLGAHDHGDAVEICFIYDGQVDWWYADADGRPHLAEVAAGEVYLTPPRTRHGGLGGALQPCELAWLVLTADALSGGLFAALRDVPRVSFPCGEAGPIFARLIDEHRRPGPFAAEAAAALLATLAVAVARASRATGGAELTPATRRAVRFVEKHAISPGFRVEDAARAAGVSVGRLHVRFREEIGTTPAAMCRRLRVTAAKRRLAATEEQITSIALACGFASGQYLATAFRRATGTTPAAYRALARR